MSFKKSSTILLSSLMCLALVQPASAGAPPFPNKVISINARGQKISDVITDVFNQAGLKVKVSSAVTGKAQGMFVGSPQEIWTNISNSFGLVAYYDGSVVRINAAKEITTRTVQSDDPAQVVKEAKRLGLSDSNNTVRASGGAVLAAGVPEFLNRIGDLARQMRPPQTKEGSGVIPVVPPPPAGNGMNGGIATPLSPAYSGASILNAYPPSDVSYQVRVAAGPGRRYETRVYQLKFRDASDKVLRMQNTTQYVPGVASLLMELKGINSGIRTNVSNSNGRDDDYGDGYGRRDRRDRDDGYYRDDRDYDDRDYERRAVAGPSILADVVNNAILIKDLPGEMNEYTALISQLDREQPVIEFELVSIVYNRDDMQELGVDWSIGFGGLRMLFGGSGGSSRPNIAGSYVWGNGDVISAQITALQEQGAMRVTDRQFIAATNNETTEYNEGGQQYAKLESERATDLKTLNYGLSVRLKPAIVNETNNLRVRMNVSFRDTTLTSQAVDGIPSIKGPSFTVSNIVPHGEAVMLAGRTVQFEYDKMSKTPILGDIPIFKALFNKKRKGMGTMERAVMIIPRVRAPGGMGTVPLRAMPQQQMQQMQMIPNAITPQPTPTKSKKKSRSKRRNG